MNRTPMFSLLHATARLPGGWIPAHQDFLSKAVYPQDVEYILGLDVDYHGKVARPEGLSDGRRWLDTKVGWTQRRDSTAAWNAAALQSTGEVLITIADDLFPSREWDEELRRVFTDTQVEKALNLDYGGGLRAEFAPFVIMTRKVYERLGYVCYPEYAGMYADDDWTQEMLSLGVMVEAPGIHWDHAHKGANADAVYSHQNSPEHYRQGEEVFRRRWPQAAKRKGL